MSNTVKLPTCPKCQAPIPNEAPQGLCPRCVLLGAATATEQGVPATATSEIPSIDRISKAFPQLEVLELIGRGGMGFVFKARQPHLDRFVALKLLPDKLAKDALFAERFNREGRVLAKLNHPNIVSVFDFGQTGGFYYLTMEYVDGVNLRQAMRAGRFSPAEALALVPKVCEALQYAHEQGILHRDIKPENILLDTKGRVKIADFGIAKLVGEDQPNITLTNTGAALGTPHYMAPEQFEKPATVDHRADIYSLGVVFYEMLTGELPIGRFAAPSAKTPVNASVDDVVFRTLEKDRELRFQSAGEMRTQVEHLTEIGFAGAASDESLETTQAGPNGTGVQSVIPLVENPARALLAAGILTWAGSTAAIIWMSFGGAGQQCLNTRPELVLVITPLFALSSVIIAGALKMRKLEAHPLAVAASVLAILTSLGSIVGLPAGLWAFRTLRRPNVRAAFARQRQAVRPGPSQWSGAAIWGAVFTVASLPIPLVAIVSMLSRKGGMGVTGLWLTLITACGFGVVGTILGCLAVSNIIESRGRLRGLALGWFGAAMWPLLVVVGIPLSTPWFNLAERSGRGEAGPDVTVPDTNLWVMLTFTAVELREVAGVRWLALDYLDQVNGGCEKSFPWESSIPEFKATIRTSEFFKDMKASPPMRHQRIEYRIPDSLPRESLEALHAAVEKQWKFQSILLKPGEQKMLFELFTADNASLKAWVKAGLPTHSSTFTPSASPLGASAELWAPKLTPGEKPNVSEILQEAKRLTDTGRYEEALQHHIWYHNHALEIDSAQTGVRLSFALSYWTELAQRYPKAREALMEILDRGTQAFAKGQGHFALFMEVSAINGYVGRQKETLALFKSILSRDPKLARQCYWSAEDLLVEKGDYALCESFIPDFQKKFETIRAEWQRTISDRNQDANRASLREHARRTFIKDTRKLVEILVGVSRNTEAEAIRDQAVTTLDTPELRSAVTDAEQKVADHSVAAAKP